MNRLEPAKKKRAGMKRKRGDKESQLSGGRFWIPSPLFNGQHQSYLACIRSSCMQVPSSFHLITRQRFFLWSPSWSCFWSKVRITIIQNLIVMGFHRTRPWLFCSLVFMKFRPAKVQCSSPQPANLVQTAINEVFPLLLKPTCSHVGPLSSTNL